MKSALTTQITEEADISEVIETVKLRVRDAKLPETEIVRILWDVLMDAVQWSGKNQQQNANAALCKVKTWAELLNTFCTSGKLELELMYKVQMQCYEDAKLMKLFPEIIRSLYDQDVLAEDTILHWLHKGTNPKGRQTFVKALEPFLMLKLDVRELAIQFGCVRIIPYVRDRLKLADFTHPVFMAVAFYLCAKKHKLKVDKIKLIELCGTSEAEFSSVSTTMKDLCHNVFGVAKEEKDPKEVKTNRDLLDVLPSKRKDEDGGYLSDDGAEG
ncbi:unnamed protein product [Trifolium pratense]|uniref:Uncharacterized protein n=1 Tax=Trifolium pratense TaxID=57577 RepID=A0ACB0LYJ8_TRIPR|nr:unnamed protein product [Trifolium pratense]